MAAEGLVEDAAHDRVGMKHEVPPHEPAAVGEAVGELRRARVEEEPRCADAVGGEHDRARLLLDHAPVAIVVEDAVRAPVRPHGDLAHAGLRHEARAEVRAPSASR